MSMLVPDNIRPEDTIYFNGAKVLQVILEEKRLAIADLYVMLKKKSDISFATMLLCLDWLYLMDCVEVNEGEVVLCS